MLASSQRLNLANLIKLRQERGDRVLGLETANSEYLVEWVSNLEILVTKVSTNRGLVETGQVYRGNKLRLESDGPYLRIKLLMDGSDVLTTSPIRKTYGLDEFLVYRM